MENTISFKDYRYDSNYYSGMVTTALLTSTVTSTYPVDNLQSIFIYNSMNFFTKVRYESNRNMSESRNEYHPRTPLGEKLLALRRSYIDNGGVLLNSDELEVERHVRRGGLHD